MKGAQFGHCLELHEHNALNNEIDSLSGNAPVLVLDIDPLLAVERKAARIQLETEGALIDFLAEPWTEYPGYREAYVHHPFDERFFRLGKRRLNLQHVPSFRKELSTVVPSCRRVVVRR